MNYCLFETISQRKSLYPFTLNKPIADLRVGIDTIFEKWEHFLNSTLNINTVDYLSDNRTLPFSENTVFINATCIPEKDVIDKIKNLDINEGLFQGVEFIAVHVNGNSFPENFNSIKKHQVDTPLHIINEKWDLFSFNESQITKDFYRLTSNRKSERIPETISLLGDTKNIFIEKGAKLNFTILNAEEGPIYIGKNAEIMEGSIIRGPFNLGESSVVKLGSKIYGGTSIGPFSKVGGEVKNSIIMGYSNKGHEGFLGDSVIGYWCNLGADTNTSNMKNNYSKVRIWSYEKEDFVETNLQFCGLMMGDYSKSGINTMFNTGTVTGLCANIYGGDFPPKFIPSFSFGGTSKDNTYIFDKAIKDINAMMKRRNKALSDSDFNILKNVFDYTSQYRK